MKGLLFSPLEPFRFKILVPLSWWAVDLGIPIDFSMTDSGIASVLAFSLVYCLFLRVCLPRRLTKGVVQALSEALFTFIHDVIKQQAGNKGIRYFAALSSTFVLVMLMNVIGLVPYSFTSTSQLCYTFTMGTGMFMGIIIIGLIELKIKYFKQFIPETKGILRPFLICIEVFSYFVRPFSLSIRLFANMLAGHTLMHILAGFGVTAVKQEVVYGIIMALPIIAVSVLEIGIALLQAYVFFVLLAIYLKESIKGH